MQLVSQKCNYGSFPRKLLCGRQLWNGHSVQGTSAPPPPHSHLQACFWLAREPTEGKKDVPTCTLPTIQPQRHPERDIQLSIVSFKKPDFKNPTKHSDFIPILFINGFASSGFDSSDSREACIVLLGYFGSKCFCSDLTLFMALKGQRWSLRTEIIKISVLVYAF